MTPEKLNEIKARADAATPEPWYHQQTFSGQHFVGASPSDAPTPLAFMHRGFAEQARNAEFIAHARTDIPALLQAIEILQAENQNVSKIATALIDIHNALPSASADVMAAMPEDDNEYEYLMEQYSNLLVTLWDIMHRLDRVDLEAIASQEAQAKVTARSVWPGEGW